jgi:hypothetical protein
MADFLINFFAFAIRWKNGKITAKGFRKMLPVTTKPDTTNKNLFPVYDPENNKSPLKHSGNIIYYAFSTFYLARQLPGIWIPKNNKFSFEKTKIYLL